MGHLRLNIICGTFPIQEGDKGCILKFNATGGLGRELEQISFEVHWAELGDPAVALQNSACLNEKIYNLIFLSHWDLG